MTTTSITPTKKITMATVKSFVNKNRTNLFIKKESAFSGMSDMVDFIAGAKFEKAVNETINQGNTLGISGAWFVGQSNDYLTYFENADLVGIEVYNSCGSFTLAISKTI